MNYCRRWWIRKLSSISLPTGVWIDSELSKSLMKLTLQFDDEENGMGSVSHTVTPRRQNQKQIQEQPSPFTMLFVYPCHILFQASLPNKKALLYWTPQGDFCRPLVPPHVFLHLFWVSILQREGWNTWAHHGLVQCHNNACFCLFSGSSLIPYGLFAFRLPLSAVRGPMKMSAQRCQDLLSEQ